MPEDEPQGKVFSNELQNPFKQAGACEMMIDYLNLNGLGRTIALSQKHEIRKINGVTETQVLAKAIAQSTGVDYEASETITDNVPIGSIIPTAKDSDEYLVILANNEIVLIRLPSLQEAGRSDIVEHHRKIVNPSLHPIIEQQGNINSVTHSIKRGSLSSGTLYKLVADSLHFEDREKIIKTMQRAFVYALEFQQEQEKTRHAIAQEGLKIFGKVFPDFNPPPPPELPTTPTE